MEVKSTKEVHTELMMHSVKFAKDEQGRRKGQEILFKWPDIEKQLGEHGSVQTITRIVCGTTSFRRTPRKVRIGARWATGTRSKRSFIF